MPLPVDKAQERSARWRNVRLGAFLSLAGALAIALGGSKSRAEDGDSPAEVNQAMRQGIESWARATSGANSIKWIGARVPYPTPGARPEGMLSFASLNHPVTLHVAPGTPAARAELALSAAESAHGLLEFTGWPESDHDSGMGGDTGLDIYLVTDLAEGAHAATDAYEPIRYLDTASAHALADARVPDSRLAACVTAAYVQARLLTQDPSEAPSVRRSLAAYYAWLITGDFGCDDSPAQLYEAPSSSFMDHADPAAGGAMWLALLGHRYDGNRGEFIREIAQIARQRTWEGDDLRASPDLWEATNAILQVHDDEYDEVGDALAVSRYVDADGIFGEPLRPRMSGEYTYDALPVRTRPTEPALGPLGSAYYLVQTPKSKAGESLQVWLRGEYGVRWALSAVRLDKHGHEHGRVSTPTRENPKAFLAVTLDADTEAVLIVITNLSHRLPDADTPDHNLRAGYLIIDHG